VTYVRPALDLGIYLDEQGRAIPYGRRWGMGHPPEDTYSVTRHPERFAPLLEVASALRAYVEEHLDPADASAPLTITERDFPMVEVWAGVSGHERFPVCGCDACDEDVEELAALLEDFVFSVLNGDFQESWERGGIAQKWTTRDGERGSWSDSDDKAVKRQLKARGKGATYGPWVQRRA